MLQFAASPHHASPELGEAATSRWRGELERFEPLLGVEGWALAIDAPDEMVALELTVGGEAFALTQTCLPRPDISRLLGTESLCGFRFGPDIFARLARLGSHRRDLAVAVRIAGDEEVALLSATGRSPSVGDLVDLWRAAVLGTIATPERRIGKGDRLSLKLGALRGEAEALCERALRPFSDNDLGQIDGVYPASEGQVWFVGWMKRGVEPDFPAVVVDRRKFSAGVAILPYERPDLPSHSVGVIGVMDTGWVPAPNAKDGFVFLGRNGQFHLRYGPYTRVLRSEAFLAAYGQVHAAAPGGHADAMAGLLHSGENWVPGNAQATGIAAEGGVDRLLMLPGFGCFAEGWAVSPAKRVESFHMKIGDCVMVAEESATFFRARPDLQSVFSGGASVTGRAGFTTVLRGATSESASGAPLLRIVHDDGTLAVQRVEPKVLRRLDVVSDSEELLRLYPSLRHEVFYPDFLSAVRRSLAERTREPTALVCEPAPRMVVVRLPSDAGNLNLCLDQVARHAGRLAPDTGIALLTDQGRSRSEAMLRFQELRGALACPLSLFSLPHGDDALSELPWILDRTEAERFVHVGRGVLLTANGWSALGSSLDRRAHFVDRFEIVDDNGHPDRVEGAFSAACFGWSTAALLAWSVDAPRFTRGLFKTSGLPENALHDRVVAGAAMRVERPRPSRLADMIDADLLRIAEKRHEA